MLSSLIKIEICGNKLKYLVLYLSLQPSQSWRGFGRAELTEAGADLQSVPVSVRLQSVPFQLV
jgi:hypothetical protein